MAGDWFEGNGSGGAVDAEELIHGSLKPMGEIVAHGALLSMGLTSDGGALGVTVTLDGRWRREYFRDVDTMLAWCGEAVLAVEGGRKADRPSGGSRGRKRSA